jgi:hypothetical protein
LEPYPDSPARPCSMAYRTDRGQTLMNTLCHP